MKRLLTVLIALACGATAALAQTATPPDKAGAAPAKTATPAKSAYREIVWDELVPKDWDPFKEMKDLNLSALSDADPRAAAMMKRLRDVWDNAPVNPKMENQAVRIPGYVVPLDDAQAGLKEFLLVPYFGACIHTPAPPSNQIVHVVPRSVAKGFRSMDTVWVSGTLKAAKSDTAMGVSGYRLDAVIVEPYAEKAK
jgi:uncharacterized protein